MKSVTEQDSCCVCKVERGVSDLRKERALGTRGARSSFLLRSTLLVTASRKDRSGLSSFGEKRIDCRISPPSPPFSLMGGETEDACSTSGSHGD